MEKNFYYERERGRVVISSTATDKEAKRLARQDNRHHQIRKYIWLAVLVLIAIAPYLLPLL